jgi:DNA polymerase-3 subunit epsilon
MPIIAAVDVETTGLDLEKDVPLELAYVICDTLDYRPLKAVSKIIHHQNPLRIAQEIFDLTGLSVNALENYGADARAVGQEFMEDLAKYKVSYIIAHNGETFDKPMMKKLHRDVDTLPWIDTRHDIEYPASFVSRRLIHLAAEHGFVNPFPHQALTDVLTMLRILAQYNFEEIARVSLAPWVYLRAMVSYDDRDKAKKHRYQWEKVRDKTFGKTWVKAVKEIYVDREISAGLADGFTVTRILEPQ